MTSVGVRMAQLTWTAPAQNTDGLPLTNLAGYKIYYGTTSHADSRTSAVSGATSTQATLALTPGTWYFVVTALDANGNESSASNEVSKSVD